MIYALMFLLGWLGHMAWRWIVYDYRAKLEREFWRGDD